MSPSPQALRPLILQALREDTASRDTTSRAIIPPARKIRARVVAKVSGIAAGVKLAARVFTTHDRSLRCRLHVRSGDRVAPGMLILTVEGSARSIFAAERVALNFLGHLSGIATLTAAYVRQVRSTKAQILDTRKTLPGLRALEKYAVRVGGGQSHRFDLAAAVLIKTNHLRASGIAIHTAVARAKQFARGKQVEIEVTNLREFRAAMKAQPTVILLDNWSVPAIRRAVRVRHASSLLEVSGGVTPENVRAIAKTGVDRISIGRLTHSAPALDLSLRVV